MTSLFGKESRRILAIWFPYLPTERIWRQRLGASWRSRLSRELPPIVVSRREENTQRIVALDARAEALRLKPGMGVADARAMHPSLDIVEAEPLADRKLLGSLADWCDRYTPLVALDGEGGLFLDITGCAHLFGDEERMRDDLVRRLACQGFDARAGLASAPGAAWAAARFCLPPIAAGDEAAALAALPLTALRVDGEVRQGLESVGLRTVGSIIDLPRAPLARRFGRTLLLRLDQALGAVEEAVSPRLPVASLSAERHLGEPVSLREDIERLILLLAGSLGEDLERRGEGARRLELILFRVDGAVARIAVGASRPLRTPLLVARLFRERLAAFESDVDAGYGFDLVRLAVLVSARLDAVQDDLSDADAGTGEELAMFADRIVARLGDRTIFRPLAVESHLPERAVALVPFAQAADRPVSRASGAVTRQRPERPIRLFREPELVEVTAEIPEGPPASFRWRRVLHRVAAAEGPERIASEWWCEKTPGPTRDYYRVEDEDGRRYWLFREGFYGDQAAMPKWFVQGLCA